VTVSAPASNDNSSPDRLKSWEAPSLAERLTRALEAHAAAESHGSATCQQLAERLDDPLSRLLLGLVVEDDRRHESLLQSMVHRLNQDVEQADSQTALDPATGPGPSSEQLAEVTADLRGLIRDEHEGARYLRHLGRKEPNLYAGLYQLLLETIARDAEKHALILRYLLRRMEGSVKAS
jgi:rubrerythrin